MTSLDPSLPFLLAITLFTAIASIFALKLLSPILISYFQNSKELQDPQIVEVIHKRLAQAGLPILRVDQWEDGARKSANAMVVGLIHVPRFFRARLLLSESVVKDFDKDELDAILAHEISHFRLNHLSKRVWTPFATYLTIILLGVMAVAPFGTAKGLATLYTIAVVVFAYLVAFTVLLPKLVYAQELDADWFAVNHFGIDRDLYLKTLDKMLSYNEPSKRSSAYSSHPSNSERKENLWTGAGLKNPPHEKHLIRNLGSSAVIATTAVLAIGLLISGLQSRPEREPAAIKKNH